MQYNFEWDPKKTKANYLKHKVSFERAAEIFLDPFMLSIFDFEHSRKEDSWVTIGKDKNDVPLVVIHTFQEIDSNDSTIRIISARRQQKRKSNNIEKGNRMKKQYDFSKGVRGKFYRPSVRLNLPIYLDDDVAKFVNEFAKRKKVDAQTVVNKLLRSNKDIIKAIQ